MFLRQVRFIDFPEGSGHPFDLPAFQRVKTINFEHCVTFLVGENGSGKSTLLEAIAVQAGFNAEGGSRGNRFATVSAHFELSDYIQLSWMPKVTDGFFFRAESFFNFASYIDDLEPLSPDPYSAYGGRPLHEQSHGESFLNLFTHRLGSRRPALYLLDEPEAALSPSRQLAFLRILRNHEQIGRSQFIIATHSPIILGYPEADLFTFDDGPLRSTAYHDTDHYQITRQFLNAPEPILRELFKGE